jgi:predicted RNA-binding protein YlxR (DUF448 family)/ribosomal protein L7Ae-like RNA K-turn-binding protein
MTEKKYPERTCVACRRSFPKYDVIRVVAGPDGPVIDYREKLPGRAGYVCPTRECMEKALARDAFSRALRVKVKAPDPDVFIGFLVHAVREKTISLIAMAAKAGKLAAGYSAVRDAVEKGRVEMIVYAEDVSDGTREKLPRTNPVREAVLFTRDELGKVLNRELIGMVAIEDKGFADAIEKEAERLKSLIKTSR